MAPAAAEDLVVLPPVMGMHEGRDDDVPGGDESGTGFPGFIGSRAR